MNGIDWLSIVSLAACLILAISAFRSQQIGARQTVVMALAWGAIFLLVAAVISAVR